MFSVILYARVLLTIVIIGLIGWYIVSRFRGIMNRRTVNIRNNQSTFDEAQELFQDDISHDEGNDEGTDDANLSFDNVEETRDDTIIEENISELETETGLDSGNGNNNENHNLNNHENDHENDHENTSEDKNSLIVEEVVSREEQADGSMIVHDTRVVEDSHGMHIEQSESVIINVETALMSLEDDKQEEEKQLVATNQDITKETSRTTVPHTSMQHVTDIEVPKDLEASRNIAQGHSRDDIVRDKFEKHIQKIRYDAGILKQRNDLLGYEKKLVEGITLLPHDKEFQKGLADLYFQQGKYKKASSLLKKIVTDNPKDHLALWQLGEIALEDTYSEDALVYFSQAYELCDDNPKYCLSLAQWYYEHEQYEKALPMMEKTVKLRPKNIEYLVSLANVQLQLNMRDEAKQSLLRAQELDPMNISLKQYLKGL